jgi:hypothetical protein
VMLASPRSRSGAIGADFRLPHLAYERRSTGGGYPGTPLFGADLHSTICESFPPRPPSTTHPPQEEINHRISRTNDHDDDEEEVRRHL